MEDTKKKKGFKAKASRLSNNRDLMEGSGEKTMNAPVYEFSKPTDNVIVTASKETFPFDCANLVDATGVIDNITLLQFDDEYHEQHLNLFKKLMLVEFVPMITTQGTFFFYPCKQRHPSSGSAPLPSHVSSKRCVEQAQQGWVRMFWDDAIKQYVCTTGIEEGVEWNFGDHTMAFESVKKRWGKSLQEIFEATVEAKGNFVDDINDPIIQRYRGLIV